MGGYPARTPLLLCPVQVMTYTVKMQTKALVSELNLTDGTKQIPL